MSRREFSKPVRLAVIKRAMDDKGVTRCEECQGVAHPFEIDHENPDALTGEPTIENAKLLCIPCHREKTKQDVAHIAKSKRREAKHIGAAVPSQTIKSAPLPAGKARKEHPMPMPPRRPIYGARA